MRAWVLLFASIALTSVSVAQTPTWSEDIACIAFTHCAPCHRDGGPGHFELTNYPDAYFWRNEMRDATQLRLMPPWPPDPNYRSMAHERVLTQDEIDLIAAWVDGGAAEGPSELAPPPPVFSNASVLDEVDITAIMDEYVIPSSSADDYRCFVLPIDNPTDSYITALEVIPGNTEMVHHVLVFQDTTGQARQLDEQTIGPGYTNFGGIGVSSAKLIGIWAPGSDPIYTPPGMGIKLFANADIVIQVHYPASNAQEADSTRINMTVETGGNLREISIDPVLDHVATITDGPLIIGPYQVRSFHAQLTVPYPATITAVGPHSHLLGQSMKAFAVLPNSDTIPLIDIPDWDFRWQGMYNFRHPIHLPAGTVLHGEAWYDNTPNNPDNPNTPPAWVWLGEATTNEMMLFYFAHTYGFPSDENIVVDDSQHMQHHLNCAPRTQVGLDEVEARTELEVWPVPAGSVVNVRVGTDALEVVLTDLEGRVVKTTATQRDITSIDVSALARGMYTVRVRTVNGTVRRAKVILE
jgi:hypothetical protein